jgi:hypothetical protein
MDILITSLIGLGIYSLSASILVLGVYFRRFYNPTKAASFWLIGFITLTLVSLLSIVEVDLNISLGILIILSLVSLRSTTFSKTELPYLLAIILLGVIAGLPLVAWDLKLILSLIFPLIYLIINPLLLPQYQKVELQLDILTSGKVPSDKELLKKASKLLDRQVVTVEIIKVDQIRSRVECQAIIKP